MKKINLNIYKKLLLLLLALSLLPLIALGLVSYHYTRQALQDNIQHKLQELARLAMEQVDRQIIQHKEGTQVWADLEVMQDVLTDDADGRINNTLNNLRSSYKDCLRIHCFNHKGEVVASTEPWLTKRPKLNSNTEYFKQAIAGTSYVSEPIYSKEYDNVELTFSAPIYALGNRQRIIGVLTVDIDWTHIYPLLENIRIEATEQTVTDHVMLLNSSGYVIFAPEFERRDGVLLKENLFKMNIISSDLGRIYPNGYLIQQDEHNHMSLIGYARSQKQGKYDGTGWIVLVLQSLDHAFVSIRKLSDLFMFSFIILAALVTLTAHLFVRQLTIPVNDLTQAARRIAQRVSEPNAGFAETIQKKTTDEIGDLTESFNQMMQAIHDRNQRLVSSYSELEEYKNKLEEKIEEIEEKAKELSLAQEQMVRSEKLASIGQLAAGVSHELNNPLGGILGFAQYILEKMHKKGLEQSTPEDFTSYIKRISQIEQAAQRCKTIIENLLKFSRSSSNPSETKPVDVNLALENTLIFTKHHLEMNNIALIKEFLPDLPPVTGNEYQLQQVFTNIIINARQAMNAGGKLSISTAANNGNVEVDFVDTGCGIAPENLKKIFDPFFTTKEVGIGTGLGLSVSYGIIHDMGGEIILESEVGKGSLFKIRLPATSPSSPASADGIAEKKL